MSLKVADLLQIVPDIDGQIYARDFMLVRQSDMIVSYIPELPGTNGAAGKPGLSSGVERELQHAHEHAKDVYVIWKPKKEPSPFVTRTANKVFRSTEEAFAFFDQKGYFQPHSIFGSQRTDPLPNEVKKFLQLVSQAMERNTSTGESLGFGSPVNVQKHTRWFSAGRVSEKYSLAWKK